MEEEEGWREGVVVSLVVRTYSKLTHDGKERHKRRKEEAEEGDRDGEERRKNRSKSTHTNPTKRRARVLPANRQAAHSINRKHYHTVVLVSFVLSLRTEGLLVCLVQSQFNLTSRHVLSS